MVTARRGQVCDNIYKCAYEFSSSWLPMQAEEMAEVDWKADLQRVRRKKNRKKSKRAAKGIASKDARDRITALIPDPH